VIDHSELVAPGVEYGDGVAHSLFGSVHVAVMATLFG
jgi:hypothetical protein